MGVLSCSRYDCPRIMCDTYVSSVGYICNECKEEFKEYLSANSLNPQNEGEIERELRTFMQTSKDTYFKGRDMSVDEFFNSYTR